MERTPIGNNPKKRKMVILEDDDDEAVKERRFKILLPNGMSVELKLPDTEHEMALVDFIRLVSKSYFEARKSCESLKKKRGIDWKSGALSLYDATDSQIGRVIKLTNYKLEKWHILRLHDGSSEIAKTFENMWDLTPDTDLLLELPDEYTFEAALADLIDNSLQAVWSNEENMVKRIRVNVKNDKILIFDNGPGMDDSDENSLVKWGKMGASLHRFLKPQAIGGKPPYLKPYFGMFGYGGPIASMHLGKRTRVSSKTKDVKKVYMLLLDREALLTTSNSNATWKTNGGIRDPLKGEIELSHGSFTRVEIFEPKVQDVDIEKLQCHLKDIYFPYIQSDDLSDRGKTVTPIDFQVNGVDLTEVQGGEVAITNLHSCNGPEFVLQLHLSHRQDHIDSRDIQVANARLRFVYFPFTEGKENLERVLEKLKADGWDTRENFQNFSRVSIRRLGRLLPDARWTLLPLMDFRNKKGNKAHILKRCCLRVKCFIETDAGFKPTQSKNDLAQHNPFTVALKNLGSKISDKENGLIVEICKGGKATKLLTPLMLEKEYMEWILQMHGQYDEEADSGEDQAVILLSPTNKKALGISSDVVRVHQALKRKEKSWQHGQKIKVLKGACAGCHKSNVYATIEYFLLEGFVGEAGGEARIIVRPMDIPEEDGSFLSFRDENASLDICHSFSLPISVIDTDKVVAVENIEWDNRLSKRQQQKSPASIYSVPSKHHKELNIDEVSVVERIEWGSALGKRQQKSPASIYLPGPNHPHKGLSTYEVSDVERIEWDPGHGKRQQKSPASIYSPGPNHHNQGLDIHGVSDVERIEWDPGLGKRQQKSPASIYSPGPNHHNKGLDIYGMDPVSESLEEMVTVTCAWKYKLICNDKTPQLDLRVGSVFPILCIGCYDNQDNRANFQTIPDVTVKLQAGKDLSFEVHGTNIVLSTDRMTLKIMDVMVTSNELDKIKPNYRATLSIVSKDVPLLLSIPCRVFPGFLRHVELKPKITEDNLLPGFIFKELILEMFDAYRNHVREGLEVTISVAGFKILYHGRTVYLVDGQGKINLGGLLKLTAGFGESASLSVMSENETVFTQEFSPVKRILRIASEVPEFCAAGGQLENIEFEIVDFDGVVDTKIHHSDPDLQLHMLTIKSNFLDAEESIRYTFKHGRCTIPSIRVPVIDGTFCFDACHSQFTELCLTVKVHVKMVNAKYGDQPPSPDKNVMPLKEQFNHENDLMVSIVNNDDNDDGVHVKMENEKYGDQPPSPDMNVIPLQEQFNHENDLVVSIVKTDDGLNDICQLGETIKELENCLDELKEQKSVTEQELLQLLESFQDYKFRNADSFITKDEMTTKIKDLEDSAASVVCHHKMEDIIGVVALLGSVRSPDLSRMLAEYIGEDNMLAVICRSFNTASSLERYTQSGEIDFMRALHAEAAVIGKSISKRFLVMCFEDIRPYTGDLQGNDLQRKLALPTPRLRNGRPPEGFMGYAVNMVDLDSNHLQTRTASGHGLRETVLFSLLKKLQVYKTRESMLAARLCIEDGALSLDGGIIRENGILSFGCGNPFIYFPSVKEMGLSPEDKALLTQIEEKKTSLRQIEENIIKATEYHKKKLKQFNRRKEKYCKLMDSLEPNTQTLSED